MKMSLTVYYTDDSSGVVEFEKPPGAHPDSPAAFNACVETAKFTGKIVESVASTVMIGGRAIDRLRMTREYITDLAGQAKR